MNHKTKQPELFPSTVQSYGFDQQKMLRDIVQLHVPGEQIEADVTYGHGCFYTTIKPPVYKYDVSPKVQGVVKADCRKLPHEKNSLKSIMFDPPFIWDDHKSTKESVMARRFSSFKCLSELRTMYEESFREFNRVLQPGGRLIVKCQDITHGKKNYLIHNEVINMIIPSGFIALDLFILINKNRMTVTIKQQRTARKHHSYFLVFKKRSRKSKSGDRVL